MSIPPGFSFWYIASSAGMSSVLSPLLPVFNAGSAFSDRLLMQLAAVAYLLAVLIFAFYTRRQMRAPEWPMLGLISLGCGLQGAFLWW